MVQSWGCAYQDQSYDGMSLTKIPFILLATWGINASYRPPNPPPQQHERLSSSVPLENSGFVKWGPIIGRVSNCSEQILNGKKELIKRSSDRSYNGLLALLRYQQSWHMRNLHRLYPN